MDFSPKNIFRGYNSDGTRFKIHEWGRDGIGFVEMPTGLGAFSSLAVLGFILPILSLFTTNRLLHIISVIFGIYLMFDFNKYWLFSRFYMIFFNDTIMLTIISAVFVATWLNLLKLIIDLFIPPNLITFVAVIMLFFTWTYLEFQDSLNNNTYFTERNIELKR